MAIKTLHLTHAFHPTSGGISTFYRAMMEAANRLGRPMRLVVPGDETRVEPVGEHAVIYYVKGPKAFTFDKRYRMLYPHLYLRDNGAISEILRAEQPDVVEVADKFALFYIGGVLYKGMIRGVNRPLVIGVSNERFDDNVRLWLSDSAFGRWFAAWYMGQFYFSCFDQHICVSEYTADELRAVKSAKLRPRGAGITVLPMGVDAGRFRPEYRSPEFRGRLIDETGWPDDTKILLYAGRISPEKNLDLLPPTMAALAARDARVRLMLVGSGPYEAKLKAKFDAVAPGRAWLRGHTGDRDWIARLFANADVFVHPNPREPFGITPVEAMASGTPLVAPRAGGVLMYANDSNSWLAEPTPEAFAAAIEEALKPGLLRDQRLRLAQESAARLDWPIVTRMFFERYDQMYAAFRARNECSQLVLEAA